MAESLARDGNRVTLAYFHEGARSTIDAAIQKKIDAAQESTSNIDSYILEPISSISQQIKYDSLLLSATLVFCGAIKLAVDLAVWCHRLLIKIKVKYFWSSRLIEKVSSSTTKVPSPIIRFVEGFYLIAIYGRNLQSFRSELQRGKFDAVIIPEDIVGSVWPLLIKAAHESKIPALVFPYTLANQKEAVQSLKNEPLFQSKNNRIAAKLFPHWRWKADGLDLVRLPSGHIFAHELLGVAPPDPWLMNSGYANAVCVDSPASLAYFVNSGIPESKLFVTGSISQDHLYAQKAVKEEAWAALAASLGLVGDKPLLLISGCPNQLAAKVPYCAFSTIEEVAQHVGQALAPLRDFYHIVVRAHPNYLQFGEMMAPYGVVSTLIPTSRLVPLSDLFIGFASATIRWAIACAVPTVNYDIFHYCYNDFGNADGVVTLTDADAFIATLAALAPASDTYISLKQKIEHDSKFWSYLDGGSAKRIQAAIERERAKSPTLRTSS